MMIVGSGIPMDYRPEPEMGRLRTLVFLAVCTAASIAGIIVAAVWWARIS
jgi:hypothetical protein